MSVAMLPGTPRTKEPKSATKRSDATTKKSKSQRVSKPLSKPSGLSEERIVDSDSEGVAPIPNAASKAKDEDNEKKKKRERKDKHKKTAPKPLSPSPEAASPSSSKADDTSSDESEQSGPRKPSVVPAKVNGFKRKADQSSSEEESSSSESEEQQVAKKAKLGQDVNMKDESESEDESEDEDTDTPNPQSAPPRSTQPGATAAPRALQSIPAPPFDPPEGYASVKVSESATSSFVSQNNLARKQIWLINAPSNVPLKSIQEVAIHAVQDGSTVLQYKGIDYMLAEDKDRNIHFQSILLPSNVGYQRIDAKVERALKLQQKVQLPNFSKPQADTQTGSNTAGDVSRAPVSTIRPQPKGLKMRYKPPAFGPGDPGLGSESEGEKEVASGAFQFPQTLGIHEADEKQGKKKDKKKCNSEDVTMADGNMLPPSATPAKKKKEKIEKTLERPSTSASAESMGSSEHKESKEERRKRKKLKKKKGEQDVGKS